MALTAAVLYQAASLDPSQFDEDIIDPSLTEEDQKAALISYMGERILPKAVDKVALTLHSASGYLSVADFVNNHERFASKTSDEKTALIAAGESVFDDVVQELSISKLEKQVDTDAENYVERVKESRIAAKESLKLLTDWVEDALRGSSSSDRPASSVARMTTSWT